MLQGALVVLSVVVERVLVEMVEIAMIHLAFECSAALVQLQESGRPVPLGSARRWCKSLALSRHLQASNTLTRWRL